jgi:hypothetical protein
MCKLQPNCFVYSTPKHRPCKSLQPWHHFSRQEHEKSRRHNSTSAIANTEKIDTGKNPINEALFIVV